MIHNIVKLIFAKKNIEANNFEEEKAYNHNSSIKFFCYIISLLLLIIGITEIISDQQYTHYLISVATAIITFLIALSINPARTNKWNSYFLIFIFLMAHLSKVYLSDGLLSPINFYMPLGILAANYIAGPWVSFVIYVIFNVELVIFATLPLLFNVLPSSTELKSLEMILITLKYISTNTAVFLMVIFYERRIKFNLMTLQNREISLKENMNLIQEQTQEILAQQQQLVQSGKLAALGTLASGVGHELNNPLAIISGYLELIKRRNIPTELEKIIVPMQKACDRMTTIIRHLNDFHWSTKTRNQMVLYHINDIIKDTLLFYENTLKENGIQFTFLCTPQDVLIECIPTELETVFQNLIQNSLDAFSTLKDNRLRIVHINVSAQNNDLNINFEDNAGGMPPDILDHLFEPFFSTREDPSHTGLGSTIIREIILRHKGQISVESQRDNGTTYRIQLPMTIEQSASPDFLYASSDIN